MCTGMDHVVLGCSRMPKQNRIPACGMRQEMFKGLIMHERVSIQIDADSKIVVTNLNAILGTSISN